MISISIATLALLVTCELHSESTYLIGPMIRAAVSGGQVFVSPSPGDWDGPKWSGQEKVDLVYQKLAVNSQPIANINNRLVSSQFSNIQHRWHLDKSRFYYLGSSEFQPSGLEPFRLVARIEG